MKIKCLVMVLTLQLQLLACSSHATGSGMTVHEWGTFTSVQGSDGIPLEWNPLVTAELPTFVHDLNKPTAEVNRRRYAEFAGKTSMLALQRMETPVLYFYAEESQKVDVRVGFPKGIITEWYPQAAEIGSLVRSVEANVRPQSSLFWQGVNVLNQERSRAVSFPREAVGNHYYAARATEANAIEVPAKSGSAAHAEVEKFLFYRGLGHFLTPLSTTPSADGDAVVLENSGADPLGSLFVLRIRNGQGAFVKVAELKSGESRSVWLPSTTQPASSLQVDLGKEVENALVGKGLFRPEAKAMVATWRDSWFTEEGTRVLYLLPGPWTDATLPLQITPAPKQVVRLMVGRNEIIDAQTESSLRDKIEQFSQAPEDQRDEVVTAARNLHLGRFLEAATRRVMGRNPSRTLSKAAWELIQAVDKSEKNKDHKLVQN